MTEAKQFAKFMSQLVEEGAFKPRRVGEGGRYVYISEEYAQAYDLGRFFRISSDAIYEIYFDVFTRNVIVSNGMIDEVFYYEVYSDQILH
jgi:hypothetical protein